MVNYLTLKPIKLIDGTITLPGSKSISNRVLLLSALSTGPTYIENLLNSDDTTYLLLALKKLGIIYSLFKDGTSCIIHGQGSNFLQQKKFLRLFLGNAGTAVRPLIALLSLFSNNILITGNERMQDRPIQHLVEALRQGGAKIDYESKKNYLPVLIKGGFIGGTITLNSNISSQFLTSILMAAPLCKLDTTIKIVGTVVSQPYIDMTIKLMNNFGIHVENNNFNSFFIQGNSQYQTPGKYIIEGDATSASYFLAASAIKGGTVTVKGIGKNSIQGDIHFAKILKKMGAKIIFGENFISCSKRKLIGMDLDLNNIPDAAMTLAIVFLFASGRSIIRNIYNWRVKETDRLSAMANELKKIGVTVEEGIDYLIIYPPTKQLVHEKIETYNDHRIAMCFSLIALSNIPITILDPNCINKTFPKYFEMLNTISHYS